jgi:hypothetical protein
MLGKLRRPILIRIRAEAIVDFSIFLIVVPFSIDKHLSFSGHSLLQSAREQAKANRRIIAKSNSGNNDFSI